MNDAILTNKDCLLGVVNMVFYFLVFFIVFFHSEDLVKFGYKVYVILFYFKNHLIICQCEGDICCIIMLRPKVLGSLIFK
jgi:hypothetical protein